MVMDLVRRELLKRPFVFILLPYLSGIWIGRVLDISLPYLIIPALLLASLLSHLILKRLNLFLLLLSLSLVGLGAWQVDGIIHPHLPSNHIRNFADGRALVVEGRIYSSPHLLPSKQRLYLDVERVSKDGADIPATGRLLLTLGDNSERFGYGERIRFRARIKTPKNFGNPGGFDYEGYLASKGIYATGYVRDTGWIAMVERYGEGYPVASMDIGSRFHRLIDSVRERIGRFIDRYVDYPVKEVEKALVIGERGGIPVWIKDIFIRTGTAHLLAISGLHIGIIAFFSYLIINLILKRSEYLLLTLDIRKVTALFTLIPVTIYGLIAGFSIPTQRAVVFAMIFLLAILMEREIDPYNLLAVAGFFILYSNPLSLFQASFQLSFVAVLSIIVSLPLIGYERMGENLSPLNRLLGWFRRISIVSMITFIATAPVLLIHFHRISPAGIIANLIAIPMIGFIALPLLIISASLSLLSFKIAMPFLIIASFLLKGAIGILSLLSQPSWASFYLSTPSSIGIAIYYGTILTVVYLYRRGVKRRMIALIISIIAVSYISAGHLYGSVERSLRVTFISVGQGESTLVEFPNGRNMLVDGGGMHGEDFDVGERVIAPLLWQRGVSRIDYIILSHPQSDHFGGLGFIVRNFSVGRFLWNGDEEYPPEFQGLMGLISDRGIKTSVIDSSMPPIAIDGARIEFLNPPSGSSRLKGNNRSVVFRLSYGGVSFLFTGDIEAEAEKALVASGRNLKATVLKVPHHGSSTSSTTTFLEKVQPDVAVISAGYMNGFGFPHNTVLKRLYGLGIKVFRTDRDGAITIKTDGNGFSVDTYR